MGTVTINLAAAGLTHAKGASDKCSGRHHVDMAAVTALDDPAWISTDGLGEAFQALHAQAHPDGPVSWEKCLDPACTDAWYLLYGELP